MFIYFRYKPAVVAQYLSKQNALHEICVSCISKNTGMVVNDVKDTLEQLGIYTEIGSVGESVMKFCNQHLMTKNWKDEDLLILISRIGHHCLLKLLQKRLDLIKV